jgi:phenylpropionate dioxygenase-like ring-hydroxylating dioxygenase large terminal subunit
MLKHEDNERLVRVGPGRPAGELFRRYWQPALLSEELAERDGAPLRVRLLGEDLIAFRDTTGRVGLVEAFCPHRRAPLYYGRNEECGLRCVYHGWKFDADGKCVDLPSEPEDSTLKDKVRLVAYPTAEKGGVVWAYLGPRETMPPTPDYEWMRAPETHRHVSKTHEQCNYLQALEGGLDTTHSSFLHNNRLGGRTELRQRDRAPRLEVFPTDYGYYYVSHRNAALDGTYVRLYHYVMPAQQMRGSVTADPGSNELPTLHGHLWVPIDDEHTWVYNWLCAYDRSVPMTPEYVEHSERHYGRGKDDLIPGTYVLKRNKSNEYLLDRAMQRTSNYTGIVGVNTQDYALQEGMGPIVDSSREHLGTSDKAIIQMRQLLLEATREVERGARPKGADPETHRGIRPHDGLVPAGADWRRAFGPDMVAKW